MHPKQKPLLKTVISVVFNLKIGPIFKKLENTLKDKKSTI